MLDRLTKIALTGLIALSVYVTLAVLWDGTNQADPAQVAQDKAIQLAWEQDTAIEIVVDPSGYFLVGHPKTWYPADDKTPVAYPSEYDKLVAEKQVDEERSNE